MSLSSYRRLLAVALVGATLAVLPTGADAALPPRAQGVTLVAQTGAPRWVSLSSLGDGTGWKVTTPPEHGTLDDCSDGLCNYTSDLGFIGEDAFTYTSEGPGGTSASGVVRFVVRPNRPPIVYDLHLLVAAGQPLTFDSGAIDGTDPIQTTIEAAPEHGTVSCDGRKCTYVPEEGFLGTDSFTWRVSDGEFTSRLATTRLTVSENRAPALFDKAVIVRSGGRVRVFGQARDPDGAQPVSYVVTEAPDHGQVVDCASAGCSYVADEGYRGTDSFTWTASDGHVTSREARVSVSVHRNAPPQAADGSRAVYAGHTSTLTEPEVGYDADYDPLTIELVTPAKHGTAVCAGDKCSYTPDADFTGPDSISYRLNDGQAKSGIATMSYDVLGPRPPTVSSGSVVTISGRRGWIFMSVDYFFPGSNGEIEVVDGPEHGTILGCNQSLCAFQSDPGYTGPDSVTWRAASVYGPSPTATTSITVMADRAPVAQSSTQVKAAGRPGQLQLNASDPDSDDLRYIVVTPPEHGELGQCYKTCLYTPDAGFTGTDSFQWKVSDGSRESEVATNRLTVQADQPPTVTGRSAVVNSGGTVSISFPAGIDPEGWVVQQRVETLPEHGLLSQCSSHGCRYQPDPGFTGVDSFTVVGDDGERQSSPATYTITVRPNTAPTADDATLQYRDDAKYGQWLPLPFKDDTQIMENDLIQSSAHVVKQPGHGIVPACDTRSCFYMPDPGFAGVDTFQVQVTDGLLEAQTATIGIEVGDPADLKVELTGSASSAKTGDQVRWQATVRNSGEQAATGAKVSFTIPAAAKIDRTRLPDACRTSAAAAAGTRVTCRVGTLESHQTRRLSLTSSLLAPGRIAVLATASSPTDVTSADNTARSVVHVVGPGCSIIGTVGSDRLRGTSGSDVLCGLGGADELRGLGGRDHLLGGNGSDMMIGGPGFDHFLGGLGHDRIIDGPH